MNRILLGLLAATVGLSAGCSREDRREEGGKTPEPRPDPAAELAALEGDYGRAVEAYELDLTAWLEAHPPDGQKSVPMMPLIAKGSAGKRDDAPRPAAVAKLPPEPPDTLFVPRFEDLAKRGAGTATAAKAWARVFDLAFVRRDGESAGRARAALVRDHLNSEEIGGYVDFASHAADGLLDVELVEGDMNTILAKSPHAEIRASALFQLGQLDMEGPRYDRQLSAGSRMYFERLVREYPESDSAESAAGIIFAADHLQVGMKAPEMTGTDAEGKPFALSGLRGKVVLLDFWGFW